MGERHGCSKWEGITCGQDRTITHVLWPFKGLEGNISRSLGILDALQHLDISHNSLSSGLPSELVSSSSITILDVSFNHLNGTLHELPSSALPQTLQYLTTLTVFELCFNEFSGSIPPSLGNCSRLESSGLDTTTSLENSFSGKIPVSIGQLKKLEDLRLNNNNMSGELPFAPSNCTNLITIDLKSNNFSGV
ncbi:Tyrosine-sulfated glycopeptide receptor 1 [Hordeum vulgare]|nr:Tyrosine-sulfated glycopeptide receptor 1 [Hordeum vulgare]